jgi:stearoyl-CoA desaturase (delta-9 desaturase)
VRLPARQIFRLGNAPFLLAHFVPLLAFVTGVHRADVLLAVALFWGRMFFITAGYHRYFAHRSYRLARVPQFLMAFGGLTAAQKGPLWWAANHRDHHKYADTPGDPHSPEDGLFWSHIGWILSGQFPRQARDARIEDFSRFPELRFLDKYDWLGAWALGVACYAFDGWRGLVVGFFCSTVALWHATFMVNSAAHLFGRRRYGTTDTSRNSVVVAALTMGEGWHNNHHHYPACARQGFKWWEIDPTYMVLKSLSWVGIVRDLREPPASARGARLLRLGHLDVGMFRQQLSRAAATAAAAVRRGGSTATAEVQELTAALSELAERAERLAKARRRAERLEQAS